MGLWPGLWKFTSFDGMPGVISKQIATQTEASEINPSHIWFYFYILSLLQIQWLFNKLKWSQYFPPPKGNRPWIFDAEAETPVLGHMIQSANSLEKTLILGKIEGRRRRGWRRMRWLDGITNSMDMNLSKFQEIVKRPGSLACYIPWGCKASDTTEWLHFLSSVFHSFKSF